MSTPIPNSLLKPKGMATPAAILSIGTANPTNIIDQSTYPDYFFRVTNSEHLTELKQKFKRICEKSKVKKRHFVLTEEILEKNPNLFTVMEPSLAVRQEILSVELPKLGMEAAVKAIEEWGQPKSEITHLIFCTTSSVDLPGADYHLANMLNLDGSVNRLMLAQQGCAGGGTAIRVAKDIAENNGRARVLVVCVETSAVIFRGPNEERLDDVVGAAIFGDGASAVVIGADAIAGKEKPVFRIISATQTVLPNSESINISGKTRETGLTYSLSRDVPDIIAGNITEVLHKVFDETTDGGVDWNSLFWAVHPGGPAILDRMEAKLGLNPEKLKASRHVLSEYGNMSSATVMFVLDEMRRRSTAEKMLTTGEGVEVGVLLAFGPGITVELVVLHCVRI